MAWGARSGLKRLDPRRLATGHRRGLNGLGSPFGIETRGRCHERLLDGLG